MIWQNPWALAGLGAIILPIVIHFLARHRARTLKFPTLRFVHATTVVPTRRTRLSDPLLLLVRIAIIACAAAALAQPLFATGRRNRSAGRTIARAIVVDTSVREPAQSISDSLTRGASVATIARTTDPVAAIPGIISWLRSQNGQREMIVVSDFQQGDVDSASIARVPDDITVRLIPIDSSPTQTSARDSTRATLPTSARALPMLAASDDEPLARATLEAAYATGAPTLDIDSSIVIVFPRATDLMNNNSHTRTPDRAWMVDIAARIRTDAQLADAAAISLTVAPNGVATGIVLARAMDGSPLAVATADSANGHNRLLIISRAEPGTLAAAALVAATLRAATPRASTPRASTPRASTPRASHNVPLLSGPEPATIPIGVLRTWERNATSAGPRADQQHGDASDARWLWIGALALIALESWMRKQGNANIAASPERLHDRAA